MPSDDLLRPNLNTIANDPIFDDIERVGEHMSAVRVGISRVIFGQEPVSYTHLTLPTIYSV